MMRCPGVFNAATLGRQGLYIVLTMWEHVWVRWRGEAVWGVQSMVCEVWMVLVVCVKIARWYEVGRR